MVNKPNTTHTSRSSHRLRPVADAAWRLGLRQQIDDAAEQHRLGELRNGQSHIGERQGPAQSAVRPELFKDAAVKAEKTHSTTGGYGKVKLYLKVARAESARHAEN